MKGIRKGIRKRLLIAAGLAVLGTALVPGIAYAGEQNRDIKLVVLHTNDVHGYMAASDKCLGMEAVAQLRKDYEEQGYDVLLMDAGDILQGNALVSFSQGASAVSVMNATGYDVMALGNHDFDYGSDVLEKRISEMNFPALAANITVDATGEPFTKKNALFELSDGTKVGVFGLDTPATATTSAPKNTAGLTFATEKELYAVAQAQIDELKEQGCSIVICLAHLGEGNAVEGINAKVVVENTRGLSVMIDGHDHRVENQTVKDLDGNDVLIAESGYYLNNIGILTYEDGKFSESLAEVGSYTGSDPEVAKMVAGISAEVKDALSEVITNSEWDLIGDITESVETNLGDLAADAVYWQVSQASAVPDAAVINGGGFRSNIKAGEIRKIDIYNLYPFNNQMCTIQLTGAELLESLEAATQSSPASSGAFPQISHMKFTLDTTVPYQRGDLYPNSSFYAPAAPGTRVTITEIGGKPFDPKATYTIATNDFIACGGDSYYRFAEVGAKTKQYVGYLDNEALINYMQTELGGKIPQDYKEQQGRITMKEN